MKNPEIVQKIYEAFAARDRDVNTTISWPQKQA